MSKHSTHDRGAAEHPGEVRHVPACHKPRERPDYLLWVSLLAVVALYVQYAWFRGSTSIFPWYEVLSASVFDLMNTMWWGIVIGIFMVAVLSKIPREFVTSILGTNSGLNGIVRATAAGVLLDLCSHGILMVGAKLYERGASIGQVMAFLIASPWNSFSLTLILIALIGIKWTLAFIALSMAIAIVVGLLFDMLVSRKILPSNTHRNDLPPDFEFWKNAMAGISNARFTPDFIKSMLFDGLKESRMVIRWILFGVLLAGFVRAFVSPEQFGTYFGPTVAGLGLTVLVATILEVCSEGSTPIAADLLTRANAPGNSFAFLMTGVSTDYTEVMVLKDTTKSWKIALFLPLLTVPQVILIAWLMNGAAL